MKKIFFSSLLVLLTMIGIAPTVQAQSTPQYGEELLTNIPPAATDFTGWTTSSSMNECIPQCSEGWFKTSYKEGTISQTIDLAAKGYTPIAANTLFLYAATEYKVGWATGRDGSAQMYVECLDADGKILATNTVLNRTGKFGTVETTLVCDMFTIPANTTQLRYVLKGKDQCNWSGHFGTWFRNMSCQVWDSAKFNETIKVSVVPALGDSITLSKTSDFHFGDTITVSATYPEHPILWFSINKGVIINTNQVVCWGDSIVVNAHLKYDHAITCNGTHATIKANPAQASMGDTVTLSYTMDENCIWGTYTTDIDVKWIDANRFIMPDEAVTIGNTAIVVKSIPYFEGFEEGNTDQKNVAGWLQQSESGDRSWVANSTQTDYNRTPYAGSWNATLYGYNTDWLFQAFTLEADKEYAFSMWARSYDSSNILVQLGNQANKNAMSVTVVPTTTLSTKDYQYLSGKITVETTGTYVIGIRGYSFYSSNAISIDSIMVREAQAHTITLNGTHATLKADKATASLGDTVTLTRTMEKNYFSHAYTTDINVEWIDANRFIMPDEDVTIGNTAIAPTSIPYFEGFEEGNTDQQNVADWLQQSERGDYSWVANISQTSSNRTPYAGKWNATLYQANTDWLFQYITLEQGKTYRFSMHARQTYSTASYANITVQLGTFAHKDSMQTTIVPQTSVTNGNYQLITGTFSVETTGNYIIGIKGYISSSSYYLSIDNIGISEDIMHTISTTNAELGTITVSKNSTVFGDTIIVSHTMTKGIFAGYATNTPVHWISDTSFVVLHDDVVVGFDTSCYHALPFFEGFENGNTDQKTVAGWAQQSERGSSSWVANATQTDYNRTPYAGSWNATLYCSNTDWLYTIVPLKADTPYDISLYARQDYSSTPYANITVALGKGIDKDSMTINLIPQTGITNGDYQWLKGTFSVPTDGYYVLGIKGYMDSSPHYISLDNILLQEHTAHTIIISEQECGTLIATHSSASMGDTVTLSYTMNSEYFFKDYTTDVPVQWVDANRFIMPAEDVTIALDAVAPKTIPYFEGFEKGNSDQQNVAGWLQQSENGDGSWVANSTKTDYNRTPYAGSWNATLYGYNTDWLFQALTLEAGKEYAFSMWARSSDDAYIRVMLGNEANKNAMSVTVVPTTTLSTKDYQYLSGKITVKTTGTYFIGIRGYSGYSSNAISIDSIMVREAQAHAITLNGTHATLKADKATASVGDTVTLSYTLDKNCAWGNYTTDIDVKWIDANRFIMPDEAITIGNTAIASTSIPYFEGFEKGNSDQQNVAGWLQQSENGDRSWVANSTQTGYNRTPYAGSWNATLYGYNTDWLFQAFTLEEGKEYAFSMWARSYNSSNILVQLGNQANKNAMSVTLVPTTTLSTKDYQYLSGKITVETTGTYVIGIRGYSDYSSNAISIDSIMVREAQAHAITLNGTHATLKADKATASVGDTVNLSSTMDENYVLATYTTDIYVRWIDANRFIMPDEAVTVGNTAFAAKPVPYFEGFEEGNTDQKNVAGWLQQSESGSNSWVANSTQTDRNRTPYAGSWNATLYYSNTDWLFQALALEVGENYALSLYARQDYANTTYANITAALGNAFNKDAMTTTLISKIGLTNGDYQLLSDTFQVAETKAYALGIKGYINGSPYYISLDNILVSQEVYPLKDSLFFDVLTEDAARTALAALTLTAKDTKGNTKHTFENLAENWVLDLVNHTATYTVADSLLPMGYFFADSTATIIVNLIDKHTVTIGETVNGSVSGESGTFDYGTEITLTATADEHYHFVQWSDGTKDATYTFTLTGDTILTATFAIDQHMITIGELENGSVTGAGTYDYGTEVTLTATPEVGYHFVQWSDGTKDATYIFTLTGDTTLTAEFAINQHTVTIGEAVNGSVTGAGTYDYNTEVTLTATPAKHYHFVKWSNGATDATYTFPLTSDTTLTAEFAIDQHTVTLGEAVNGSVTGAGTYDYNTEVTLTATPAKHYHFVKWSNGATDATYTFPLTSDTTLTAEFAIDQHTVTLGEAVNGSVTGAGTYDYNTEVTLTATADTGYSFDQWSDGNTDNPRVITLTEDIVITAIFKKDAATQLTETNVETKVQKVMRNGQVFILRNGITYDLTGRKAE